MYRIPVNMPVERVELAWQQSLLPESAGGMGIHDTLAKAAPC